MAEQPYTLVIGLEVHVQLATASKLFCRCENRYGAPPNTLTCPVCAGLPGALPVMNRRAYELSVRAALGLKLRNPLVYEMGPKELFLPGFTQGISNKPV